jgi:hypothetical protein
MISVVSRPSILVVHPFYWILKSVCHTTLFRQCLSLNYFHSAGQDATEAFFSLHRYEVLQKPQYQRLQIGTIEGEESVIYGQIIGEVSKVPYAEPNWLVEGYHSPYYTKVYRRSRRVLLSEGAELVVCAEP